MASGGPAPKDAMTHAQAVRRGPAHPRSRSARSLRPPSGMKPLAKQLTPLTDKQTFRSTCAADSTHIAGLVAACSAWRDSAHDLLPVIGVGERKAALGQIR